MIALLNKNQRPSGLRRYAHSTPRQALSPQQLAQLQHRIVLPVKAAAGSSGTTAAPDKRYLLSYPHCVCNKHDAPSLASMQAHMNRRDDRDRAVGRATRLLGHGAGLDTDDSPAPDRRDAAVSPRTHPCCRGDAARALNAFGSKKAPGRRLGAFLCLRPALQVARRAAYGAM